MHRKRQRNVIVELGKLPMVEVHQFWTFTDTGHQTHLDDLTSDKHQDSRQSLAVTCAKTLSRPV